MNILSVEHLTRVYGSGDTAVRALDDVSFTIEAGEFVAIIGSVRFGKVDASPPYGRRRPSHLGHRAPAGPGHL